MKARNLLVFLVLFGIISFHLQARPRFSKKKICAAAIATLIPLSLAAWEKAPRWLPILEHRNPLNGNWEGATRLGWGGSELPFGGQTESGGKDAREFMEQNFSGIAPTSLAMLDAGFTPSLLNSAAFHNPYLFAEMKAPENIPACERAHGTGVANLIFGESPVGISPAVSLDLVIVHPQNSLQPTNLRFEGLRVTHPRLISIAMTGFESWEQRELNRIFQETGAVVVIAIGNLPDSNNWITPSSLLHSALPAESRPLRSSAASNAAMILIERQHQLNGIFVGSLDLDGKISSFTPISERLDILAFGGETLQTITHDKIGSEPYSRFGRTSGAQALVTGAVANLLALVPDLSQTEVRTLLQRTSLPVAGSNVGSLNALRLVYVGDRLRNRGFSTRPADERESLLLDSRLYDFSAEAQQLWSEAEALSQTQIHERLALQRRSFLLDPTAEKAQALERLLANQGFSVNARYYHSQAEILSTPAVASRP